MKKADGKRDSIKYFECDCTSIVHTLRFMYDKENDELSLEMFLYQHNGLFKRVWSAIKYILGIKGKNGHWDCVLISRNRLTEFQNYVKIIRK